MNSSTENQSNIFLFDRGLASSTVIALMDIRLSAAVKSSGSRPKDPRSLTGSRPKKENCSHLKLSRSRV